ncbi:hypothetical protein LX32DRAFT_228559 [Colletotrichum zoysiae]|uniref:Uncharacterized protein n=1 Tax=Colletotrichum zoysiae TaxID=1216348 RepID=A0AAD9HN16_9PEZI|nr:hypothetical protein LX32DRAFT_228559 [Colletotrichum zoysiae]
MGKGIFCWDRREPNPKTRKKGGKSFFPLPFRACFVVDSPSATCPSVSHGQRLCTNNRAEIFLRKKACRGLRHSRRGRENLSLRARACRTAHHRQISLLTLLDPGSHLILPVPLGGTCVPRAIGHMREMACCEVPRLDTACQRRQLRPRSAWWKVPRSVDGADARLVYASLTSNTSHLPWSKSLVCCDRRPGSFDDTSMIGRFLSGLTGVRWRVSRSEAYIQCKSVHYKARMKANR